MRRVGQGMSECGLMIGLASIVAISIITYTSDQIDKILMTETRTTVEDKVDPELREAMKQSHRVDAGRRRFEIWKIAFQNSLGGNSSAQSVKRAMNFASIAANEAMFFLSIEPSMDEIPHPHSWAHGSSGEICIHCRERKHSRNAGDWCNVARQNEKSTDP